MSFWNLYWLIISRSLVELDMNKKKTEEEWRGINTFDTEKFIGPYISRWNAPFFYTYTNSQLVLPLSMQSNK